MTRSIAHLLDHTCDVYRRSETLGEYREVKPGFTKVESGLECTFTRRDTVLGEEGPGVRPIGDRTMYFDLGFDFEDRDVVKVTAGPAGFQGPQELQVESIAVPRGNHIELRVTQFGGDLPEDGS